MSDTDSDIGGGGGGDDEGRSSLWKRKRAKKEPSPRLPIDPDKVNKRTGRLEAVRPRVEGIGSVKVYADYFGDLCAGRARALISGSAVLFSDGLREYSFEALPGGFAFLFNTADTSEAILVSESLDTLPGPAGGLSRARELLPAVAAALQGLGFDVPATAPPATGTMRTKR